MEGLESVISFFKHTQTKGHKLFDLYKKYCFSSYPIISQEQFENALVFMDKWIIRELKEKCKKCNDYGEFIKKEGLITKKLWNHLRGIKESRTLYKVSEISRTIISSSKFATIEQAIKNGATRFSDILSKTGMAERTARKKLFILLSEGKIKVTGKGSARRFHTVEIPVPPKESEEGDSVDTFSQTPLIPEIWNKLHWVQKERHIRITKDLKFLESIMGVETVRVVQDACIKRMAELGQKIFPPRLEFQKQLSEPKASPELLPKLPTEPDFKSMLPIEWNSMTKGERVEFLQKVQDKRLYKYVLSIDESLESFMSTIKKNKPSPISLYVNLFSFSSDTTSEETKILLKSFVEALNMLGRARLQYVEVKDPPLIEIREVRK